MPASMGTTYDESALADRREYSVAVCAREKDRRFTRVPERRDPACRPVRRQRPREIQSVAANRRVAHRTRACTCALGRQSRCD